LEDLRATSHRAQIPGNCLDCKHGADDSFFTLCSGDGTFPGMAFRTFGD
jgi:hypothetical protein